MAAPRDFYQGLHLHKNALIEAKFDTLPAPPTGPVEGQFYFNTGDKNFYGFNGTSFINLSQIIAGATTTRGEITNANTNPAFPTTFEVGDTYFITTTAGTVGGLAVEIGDQLIRSTTAWFVVQRNLQAATDAVAGFLRLATQAETNAGSLTTAAITPATLAAFMTALLYARTFAVNIASLTANTVTTITHGLALVDMRNFTSAVYQGGRKIEISVVPSTVNAVTVEASETLANVYLVLVGK